MTFRAIKLIKIKAKLRRRWLDTPGETIDLRWSDGDAFAVKITKHPTRALAGSDVHGAGTCYICQCKPSRTHIRNTAPDKSRQPSHPGIATLQKQDRA